MSNYSYDINECISALKTELTMLIIIAIVLPILFISAMIFSVSEIKDNKTKKSPYVKIIALIALIALIVVFCFMFVSLGRGIASCSDDLTQRSFVEYKGSAKIESRKQFVFGGIPTSYTEHVISFEQDGKEVELVTKKRPDLIGDVDEIFIVYAKHSEFVIDFDIIQ